jgi:hypothetical protein
VSLSPSQGLALDELAQHLYEYLPGKPHPYGNKALSFPAVAAELGLDGYWPGGSKQPAIRQLLEGTLRSGTGKFSPLIVQIVQRGITRRKRDNPVTREDLETINALLMRVGFKIPEFHEPALLDALPLRSPAPAPKHRDLGAVRTEFDAVTKLAAHDRGFAFERFLSGLFDIHGLASRGSFKLRGEQIDGSFRVRGEIYLLEAKWQDGRVGNGSLLEFSGKVGGKAEWARGLFVSYSGFTPDGLEAFARGRQTNIVCMDGLDLYGILSGKLDLVEVIDRKVRRAAETNQAFVSVRDLFELVV